MTPQQVSASPEISKMIEDWDISQTDALLVKFEAEEEKRRTEEERIRTLEKEKNDSTIKELELEYSRHQKILQVSSFLGGN